MGTFSTGTLNLPPRRDLGQLSVVLQDSEGKPIRLKTVLLLSEDKQALGNQYRLDSEGKEQITASFPAGSYSLQVYPVGYEVGHAFANIRAGGTTEIPFSLRPMKEWQRPTLAERLATYGLHPDQIKPSDLTLQEKQRVVLDYRRYQDKAAFTLLKPTSVIDLKRWHGSVDTAFGHGQPRFGQVLAPPSSTAEGLQAVAREYIYGNSKSVVQYKGLLDEYVSRLNISVAIFFYSVVTINDGSILEIGNGSSVFFCDLLRMHSNGTLSVVGDVRADIGRYERFG
jgi:hypothetical protein